jgi:hypothetical protein
VSRAVRSGGGPWRFALVVALALRFVVALVGLSAEHWGTTQDPVDVDPIGDWRGWEAPVTGERGVGAVGAGTERWDALWYLAIARDGYPSTDGPAPRPYAFFPLFPLVVGILGRLLADSYLLAANLVALAATVAALAGTYRLVAEETGDDPLARRSVLTLATFPAAFVLVAPYTESTFLALSVWALVWARRGRWARSVPFAAGAALTRNVGVLLVVALLLEVVRQRREGRALPAAPVAAALVAAPAGLAAYGVLAWWRTGDPSAPVAAQDAWHRVGMWPTDTLRWAVEFAARAETWAPLPYHLIDLAIFLVILAGVVWMLVRLPPTYGILAAAHVVSWLVLPFPGRPLMSTYRFALAVPVVSWPFGAWTRGRTAAWVWYLVSGASLIAMTFAFANWHLVF